MSRIKRGTTANKRRKNVIKQAKGYKWSRKSKFRAAKEAVLHAGKHAYTGRKVRKRDFRSLWITRLSAAAKAEGTSYSKLFNQLKTAKIGLNRKVLSEIAIHHPEVFKQIISAK